MLNPKQVGGALLESTGALSTGGRGVIPYTPRGVGVGVARLASVPKLVSTPSIFKNKTFH